MLESFDLTFHKPVQLYEVITCSYCALKTLTPVQTTFHMCTRRVLSFLKHQPPPHGGQP